MSFAAFFVPGGCGEARESWVTRGQVPGRFIAIFDEVGGGELDASKMSEAERSRERFGERGRLSARAVDAPSARMRWTNRRPSMEGCLAALNFSDIDYALEALRLVKAYAIGAIQTEASDIASGQSREQWQQASWTHVQKLLATGHYPMMERVVREAAHPENELERGIERILAGIEAGLQNERR